MSKMKVIRITKELERLKKNPRPGIVCYPKTEDDVTNLEAKIMGPKDTPYEGGVFCAEINVPDSYPFEPPRIRFTTPVYHPNIDSGGRICLDLLKGPPSGGWKPTIPLEILLVSLQGLLEFPNPKDPLMADIATLYISDKEMFTRNAKEHTKKYAVQDFSEENYDSVDPTNTASKRKAQDSDGEGPSSKK
uniref:Putative ubiquitin-conjugating enzyme n=1 Tax=Xenopsylla cheopis TaxID=163159 RepID=A0A6M2DHM9_XENCH